MSRIASVRWVWERMTVLAKQKRFCGDFSNINDNVFFYFLSNKCCVAAGWALQLHFLAWYWHRETLSTTKDPNSSESCLNGVLTAHQFSHILLPFSKNDGFRLFRYQIIEAFSWFLCILLWKNIKMWPFFFYKENSSQLLLIPWGFIQRF